MDLNNAALSAGDTSQVAATVSTSAMEVLDVVGAVVDGDMSDRDESDRRGVDDEVGDEGAAGDQTNEDSPFALNQFLHILGVQLGIASTRGSPSAVYDVVGRFVNRCIPIMDGSP